MQLFPCFSPRCRERDANAANRPPLVANRLTGGRIRRYQAQPWLRLRIRIRMLPPKVRLGSGAIRRRLGGMDTIRHAPLGRVRPRFASASLRSRPHAYAGRTGSLLPEMYASDHADSRRGGRFRWLLSTCLAAAVGVLAILVAVAGSMESQDNDVASLEQRLRQASLALRLPTVSADGLRWALPKTDKLLIPTGAIALKTYIPDPVKQRRGTREYTMNKYYVRLAARLGPVSRAQAAAVPALNPIKLYADAGPVEGSERGDGQQEPGAPTKLIELNGILPNEDG